MNETERDQLIRKADEEHRRNLEAIERVWLMSQGVVVPSVNGAKVAHPAIPVQPKENGTHKGFLLNEVRAAVNKFSIGTTFNARQVTLTVASQAPNLVVKKASLKAALKKLAKLGELELVSQGVGRRISEYRRKQKSERT